MSDSDAWDADDYDPTPGSKAAAPAANTDKWEGEDEEDDVKDAWDADSDEDKPKDDKPAPAKPAAAKKKLRSKIALREAAEAQADEDLTEEEKASAKMHAMKMEEQAQMSLTRDMFGLDSGKVDDMVPQTKEDFDNFAKALCEKIRLFNNSEHYNDLLESITKDLVIDMSVPTLKKVKIHVEGMHSTRLKEEKAKTKKPASKGGKASLKNDLDKDLFGGASVRGGADYGDPDMDDFM